jgi:hypothetical protein
MHLEIRPEPPLEDESLLMLHMGAGDATRTAETAFNNHDAWLPLLGRGRFAVSAYAAVNDVVRDTVLSALPHRQYGVASAGAIRSAGFEIVATNTVGLPSPIARLQPFHYSLVVAEGFDAPALDLDQEQRSGVETELAAQLMPLLRLFSPRQSKRPVDPMQPKD